MQEKRIEQKLKELGFTIYEARAYLALLQNSPATRYELSKDSGVPRSAIYDIIRKLEQSGAVNALYTQPEKYVPLPPKQLFDLLERQYMERLNEARESLKNFNTELEPGHLWNIVGYENMLHKAREMIGRAKESIYLSLWQKEAKILLPDLKKAAKRGLEIIAFSFTPLEVPSKTVYSYHIPERELKKIWDRKIILVIDKIELLMGEADEKRSKKTAWTDNKAIVDIATNHIILDITLFGLRKNIEVGNTVLAMESRGFENLGKMMIKHNNNGLEIFGVNKTVAAKK